MTHGEPRRVTGTLHQSLLMVRDLDASTGFYRDIVGLDTDAVEEGNVEFAAGDCTLVLESDFDREVLDAFGLDEPGDHRGRGVMVAVEVDGGAVDEAVPPRRGGWRRRPDETEGRELGPADGDTLRPRRLRGRGVGAALTGRRANESGGG